MARGTWRHSVSSAKTFHGLHDNQICFLQYWSFCLLLFYGTVFVQPSTPSQLLACIFVYYKICRPNLCTLGVTSNWLTRFDRYLVRVGAWLFLHVRFPESNLPNQLCLLSVYNLNYVMFQLFFLLRRNATSSTPIYLLYISVCSVSVLFFTAFDILIFCALITQVNW
jgi:hypothetical protein